MHIVLVEPEIPQNTGNIARTCAATGTPLHLIGTLGFSIDEKHVRRAGLDYWKDVELHRHATLEALRVAWPNAPCFYLSTKAQKRYTEAAFPRDAFLVFGKETAGLPADLLAREAENAFRVPMRPGLRSLNLANTVALVLYEALRQNGFEGLV